MMSHHAWTIRGVAPFGFQRQICAYSAPLFLFSFSFFKYNSNRLQQKRKKYEKAATSCCTSISFPVF